MKIVTTKSPTQKLINGVKYNNYRVDRRKPFFDKTSRMRVLCKTKKILCPQTRNELADLFREAYLPVPTWLRQKITITQSKRKTLNKILFEAQLDSTHCKRTLLKDNWSGRLHLAWHDINEVPLCK